MLLIPKKTKYRKVRKGKISLSYSNTKTLSIGKFGLIAKESAYLHASQLEAARQTITRHLQRQGRVWINVFPDLGVTKRPGQIRIGKGTGSIKYWACKIRRGTIIIEIDGVPAKKAKEALISGGYKLAIKVKLIDEIS